MKLSLSHNSNRNSIFYNAIPVLFLFFMMSFTAYCIDENENNISDSTRKIFPEVKVEATKISDSKLYNYSSNTNLTKSEIKKLTSLELSEVLSYLPGIYIKDYGGLGGLKTISLRGTYSNQTAIMLNGIKLNSNQSGISDLGNLPVSMIENIEVLRSGASAEYGSGAIGGVVNLSLAKNKQDNFSIGASLGSFNENLLTLNATKSYSKFNFSTAIEYKHSDGDYPIEVVHFGKKQKFFRSNNNLTNINVALLSDYNRDDLTFNLLLMGNSSERGVPGAVLQGHIEAKHTNLSEFGFIMAVSAEKYLSDKLKLKAGVNSKANNMEYNNNANISSGTNFDNNHFFAVDNTFNFSIESSSDYANLYFLTDLVISNLNGNMIQPEVGDNVERKNLGFTLGADYNYSINNIATINFLTNFRVDVFSDNSPAFSPFLGVNIAVFETNLLIKSNISSNFRMPNFNELYYLNYGTANLKPERANSFNVALEYVFDNFKIEANGFLINTHDLILAVPKSPISWSAQNIGEAFNQGIELVFGYKSSDRKLNINANYTLQKARDISQGSINYNKLLVYVPQEIVNFNISYNLFGFDLISNFNYSSFRYSLMSNDISSVLPAYFNLSMRINKAFQFNSNQFIASVSADNITNEQYAIVKNYPMPGTIFRVGINYLYNKE